MSKSSMRLVFNSDGFRQILLSDGTYELVKNTTDSIRDRANSMALNPDDFGSNVIKGFYGGGRYIGFVKSVTPDGALAETADKVLSRSVTG